jgi:multidrug resistance protein MdtO
MTATSPQYGYVFRRRISWTEPWEFIRWEIAPYPGRFGTVARMVIAAVLVMLLVMTFRIPNATLAGYYSLLLARESLAATWRQSMMIVLGFVAGTAYVLLGMMLFRGSPATHFFWVIGTLYLVFFVMRTATNYGAAAGLSFLIATTLSVWDQPLGSEAQVDATLWQAAAIAVGAGVTVVTEAVYHLFDRSDPLITSINDLLLTTQRVLESIAQRRGVSEALRDKVLQYDITGTGRLRTTLVRQGVDPTRRAHLSALISLVGRLVELAADLQRGPTLVSDEDADRLRNLSERIEGVRNDLRQSGVTKAVIPPGAQPSASIPILAEMERTVDLIIDVFHRGETPQNVPHQQVPSQHRLFVPDAFTNPEYMRFAFAGCIASSVCYVLYNALDWQGISTSVLTCIVTALSTIGTSVQKQVLRLAGYVVGGLIIGITAQILILPNLDTIFGFTLFFAAVTALAAWVATSSPRLSYLGLQIALAFYFINLQDFQVQTDLTVARDRVIGVALGILAMGFIFDRFGTKSDAEEIRKQFSRILRMLARFGICSSERDHVASMSEIRDLRSQINDNFTTLASQMDSVQFEFGYARGRELDIIERENVQRAQPALRSIFVLELSLLRYRASMETESELTLEQGEALNLFLQRYSSSLTNTAEAKLDVQSGPTLLDDCAQRLRRAFQEHDLAYSAAILDISERMLGSLSLLRNTIGTVGR